LIPKKPYLSEEYRKAYLRSIDEPEAFWAEVGQFLTWDRPWDKVIDNSKPPFTKW